MEDEESPAKKKNRSTKKTKAKATRRADQTVLLHLATVLLLRIIHQTPAFSKLISVSHKKHAHACVAKALGCWRRL
jgi:hypothetical protein